MICSSSPWRGRVRDRPLSRPRDDARCAARGERAPLFRAFERDALVGTVGLVCEAALEAADRATVWGMYVVPPQRGRSTGAASRGREGLGGRGSRNAWRAAISARALGRVNCIATSTASRCRPKFASRPTIVRDRSGCVGMSLAHRIQARAALARPRWQGDLRPAPTLARRHLSDRVRAA